MQLLPRQRLSMFVLFLCSLCLCSGIHAEEFSENQLKAVFLSNFFHFIIWPQTAFPTANAPFSLCVLGENPFQSELRQAVQGEKPQGRNITLKHVNHPRELKGCHGVFISASEQARLSTILKQLDQQPVLTVSDIPNFTARGGIIGFYVADNQTLRFAIAHKRLLKKEMQATTRLLRVAKIVDME